MIKQFFKLIIIIFVILGLSFIFPNILISESWLILDNTNEKFWVDTSHWEYKPVLIEDGYWQNFNAKRWVDKSYYVTKNKKFWVDTSYIVNQGYWKTETDRVWVESGYYHYFQNRRWVDTSHWETRYMAKTSWVSTNFFIYRGCTSYGWNVYAFASRYIGPTLINYRGTNYLAYKDVIDYKPVYGGRILATRYHCYKKEIRSFMPYSVWVSSGYWKTFLDYYYVDTSHWETRTRKVWVDTSYKVNQGHWEYRPTKVLVKDGYWENYTEQRWVDTSYYTNEKVWVEDGYYAEPLHGEIEVYKEPKYIFTRWHEGINGNESNMRIRINWSIENGSIRKIHVYQTVNRYNNKGKEVVEIYDKNINASSSGTISTSVKFAHAGDENSKVHIFLYGTDDQAAHIYFANPINGYRSININDDGLSSNPDQWLGGNNYGKINF